MDILLKKKKLYEVENKDNNTEIHYREYFLSFSSSKPLISLLIVDVAEIVCYAELHNFFDLIRRISW